MFDTLLSIQFLTWQIKNTFAKANEMASQKKAPPPDNRRESMERKMGAEGKSITKGSHKGNTLAVFTSGGDAQGKCSLDRYHFTKGQGPGIE